MNEIQIPKSPQYDQNNKKCKGIYYPCVVCGKEVRKPKYMIECVHGGCDVAAMPDTADTSDGGYMGLYPIGFDCLKNHPELKPYVKKRPNS